MKVFISGATGVLGRRVVGALVATGHQVVGLSRSQANTDWLSGHGAEPRSGDLFNPAQLCELASGCNAALHLATAIPTKSRTTLADWALNDRIRREGTQNLIEAALGSGCQLYVQQSITFIYGDRKGDWVDEGVDIVPRPGSILQSAVDMEQIVQAAARERGLPATILRFGSFYSHDSAQTRTMLALIHKRRFPIIGDGGAYWNPIHVDDAAQAVVKAVDNHASAVSRRFNVCDDEPVTYRDLVSFIAQALGARRPIRIPTGLATLLIGAPMVRTLSASVRCRTQLIKDTLGWEPQYPDYRVGYKAVIEKWLQA